MGSKPWSIWPTYTSGNGTDSVTCYSNTTGTNGYETALGQSAEAAGAAQESNGKEAIQTKKETNQANFAIVSRFADSLNESARRATNHERNPTKRKKTI